jgi:TRAP-type C4-dicarboxylate transport system substrate-binding protein
MKTIGLVLLLAASTAAADPVVLRMATVAPEGTGWANECRTFAREVEARTNGRVHIKWYMNGVAGDETEITERMKRGQLDGAGSGGMVCSKVAPSMKVGRLPGIFQSRDEATFVMNKLQPIFEREARDAGFVYLVGASIGDDMLFSRTPVRTMADLKKLHTWRWSADDVAIRLNQEMSLPTVPADLADARQLFEQGRVDSFWSVPTAAVAFQWTVAAPYLLDLHESHVFGCVLVSAHLYDALRPEDRQQVSAAAARLGVAFDELAVNTEKFLFGGALQHQGVKIVPASESLRAEFFGAAVAARQRAGNQVVSPTLITRVMSLLSDYRAEHQR